MKLRARHLVLVSALTACGGKSPPAAPTTSSATSAGPAKVTPPDCAGAEIDLAAAMANEACQIRGEA